MLERYQSNWQKIRQKNRRKQVINYVKVIARNQASNYARNVAWKQARVYKEACKELAKIVCMKAARY